MVDILFGLSIETILFFFVLYPTLTFSRPSNLIFPLWTDKLFGKVFASPDLHKVHHHQKQEFTDSNFGFLFIFWDKLFGTYKYVPVKEIKYGLEKFAEPGKQML